MGLLDFVRVLFVDPRQQADTAVPLRRFARCAVALVTGGDDYGYFPPEQVQAWLRDWGVTDAWTAERAVRQLGSGDSAWELVRGIHLARMAAGAEYVTPERSWELIAPLAEKLQRTFSSWEEVAHQYVATKRVWAPAEADAPDLEVVRQLYFGRMPFKHSLRSPAF